MLISAAFAHDSGATGTGSPGGGVALLIILATLILLYFLYSFGKKYRRRRLERGSTGK